MTTSGKDIENSIFKLGRSEYIRGDYGIVEVKVEADTTMPRFLRFEVVHPALMLLLWKVSKHDFRSFQLDGLSPRRFSGFTGLKAADFQALVPWAFFI